MGPLQNAPIYMVYTGFRPLGVSLPQNIRQLVVDEN